MLPLPLTEITEAFLQQLCAEQWPESQTLEFKATLPGNDEAGRDEFRKDVSAMANAEGGDLVYGISTKDDKAQAVLGHTESADAAKRRFQQILESRVEPRINGIQYFNCPLLDGKQVLVLRIPSSFHGPHRVGTSTAHRFVFRDNSKTTDMSYDHLRGAFGQAAALSEKVERFHTQRVQRIAEKRTPKRLAGGPLAIVHIVPINGVAGKIVLDVPRSKPRRPARVRSAESPAGSRLRRARTTGRARRPGGQFAAARKKWGSSTTGNFRALEHSDREADRRICRIATARRRQTVDPLPKTP